MERLVIKRKCMPSFSHEDEERLLAFMAITRDLNNRYRSASSFGSPTDEFTTALQNALDKLAEHITGDPKLFLPLSLSIGGPHPNEEGVSAKQVRELLWRELRRKY